MILSTPRIYQPADVAHRLEAAFGHVFQRGLASEQGVRVSKHDPALRELVAVNDARRLVDPDQVGDAHELLLAECPGIQILDFRSPCEAEQLPGFYAWHLPELHDLSEGPQR